MGINNDNDDEFARELSKQIKRIIRSGRTCWISGDPNEKTLIRIIFDLMVSVCGISIKNVDSKKIKNEQRKGYNSFINKYEQEIVSLINQSFDRTGKFSWRKKIEKDKLKEALEIIYCFSQNYKSDTRLKKLLAAGRYELITK